MTTTRLNRRRCFVFDQLKTNSRRIKIKTCVTREKCRLRKTGNDVVDTACRPGGGGGGEKKKSRLKGNRIFFSLFFFLHVLTLFRYITCWDVAALHWDACTVQDVCLRDWKKKQKKTGYKEWKDTSKTSGCNFCLSARSCRFLFRKKKEKRKKKNIHLTKLKN